MPSYVPSNILQSAAAFTSLLRTHIYLQAKSLNLNENLAITVGGGFLGGHSHRLCLKEDYQNSSHHCRVFSSCPGSGSA